MLPGLSNDYNEDVAIFPTRIVVANIEACSGKRVSLDVESNGLYWYRDDLIGVGVYCPDADIRGYLPAQKPTTRERAIEAVRSWAPGTVVIGHNLKFDLHMLGIDPSTTGWKLLDTTVMVHLLDSRDRKSLDEAEAKNLGTASKRTKVAAAPTNLPVWDWPLATIGDYCTNDAAVAYQLTEVLMPKLRELDLVKLFQKEMEYLKLLWSIERRGILTDDDFIQRAMERLDEDTKLAERELWDRIGYVFNWRSPQKLSKALYEDFGWERPINPFADEDGVDRTKFATRGKYNKTLTDSFILMEKANHPLGALVLHLRETDKLRNYLQDYRKYRFRGDHSIHTNFNQTGTRTGRLSSSNPNLQNIPSNVRARAITAVFSDDAQRRVDEYNLRMALVARPGKFFVSIDYKQMEMRMFGVLAKEPHMLDSLRSGRDIHADNAELVWGSRDEVHREWSKTIGFGLIYGMTTGSLQFRLNMTREEAFHVTDQYWGAFPRIKPWLNETIRQVRHRGYVRYWSGRIWREDEEMYYYKGANAMIQGGCADLLSMAALRCDAYLKEHRIDGQIIDLVHDEILFELPKDDQLLVHAFELARIMEVPDLLDLPFFTDIKVGPDYGSLRKLSAEEAATKVLA